MLTAIRSYRTISLLIKTTRRQINHIEHSLMASNSLPDSPQPVPPVSVMKALITTEASMQVHPGLIDQGLLNKTLNKDVVSLMQCFSRHGHSTRLVGGAVRDLILGKPPHDLDLCTDATPDQMMGFLVKEGYRTVPTGLKHGTVMVRINNESIEITTLRVDKVTDGRHAEVEFTDNWEVDAERRDFTINALYLDCSGGVVDYFNGVDDLKARRVRFVKDADKRIQEDYLRIFRYFRFYGRINEGQDCHEASTLEAIRKNVGGLRRISVERVWNELQQILTGRHTPQLVQLMYQLGVANQVNMPQPGNLQELERVWNVHVKGPYKLKPVTLMMSLFDGEGEHVVGGFCSAWKMSTVEKKLAILIANSRKVVTGDMVKYCKDLIIDSAPLTHAMELMVYLDRPLHEINQLKEWEAPIFPLTGHDLLQLGVSGVGIGKLKTKLFQLWKESYYLTSKEELLAIASEMIKE